MLGAFLSFVAEPMIGRLVTPFFGGAVHVWTVCMMVFQGLLLLGYLYAHGIARRIGGWHLVVVAVPLLWLPLDFHAELAPATPIAGLVEQLLVHVALPFWALTTTAVVVQHWFARSELADRHDPYTLYAASNVGSLTGLLSYPLLIEPWLDLTVQRWAWSAAFVAAWFLLAGVWWKLSPGMRPEVPLPVEGRPPGIADGFRWLLLSAAPSALLLGVTNHIAFEVGSFPLVWVIPLALYLGSFVLAFRENRDQGWLLRRWPFAAFLLVLGSLLNMVSALLLFLAFFGLCWLTHYQLYVLRPPPRFLTHFYVTIAAGGWLGGLAVSLGAPVLLDRMLDLPITLGFLVLVLVGVAGLTGMKGQVAPARGERLAISAAMLLATGVVVSFQLRASLAAEVDVHRNFYGVFKVKEKETDADAPYRILTHGHTMHGIQYLDTGSRPYPLAYYHEGGPLHEGLELRRRPARVGAIGLGAGAIAYWGESGERFTFYEIDPDNEALARRWFTFLDRSAADVSVVVGDARLKLAVEEAEGDLDVIFVDAFSGDAIPLHLVTREALAVYLRRLAPDGVLIFHLSNRYYDLRSVISRLAQDAGLAAVGRQGKAPPEVLDDPLATEAIVMVMARDPDRLAPLLAAGWSADGPEMLAPAPLWTDDYASILLPLWRKTLNRFE
jgi:spermidine synthase